MRTAHAGLAPRRRRDARCARIGFHRFACQPRRARGTHAQTQARPRCLLSRGRRPCRLRIRPECRAAAARTRTGASHVRTATAAATSGEVRDSCKSCGDESAAAVQTALNSHGAQLDVDGHMGPKTVAALKTFQKQHKLKVTGKLDHATAKALGV